MLTDAAVDGLSEPEFKPETPAVRAKDILKTSQSVVVLLGEEPSFDQVAAATSLVVTWLNAGKDVVLACQEPLPDNTLTLVGTELCKHQLANQNLTISFPYNESAVDKVSYHISDDQQTFTLVIKPQKGAKPLDTSQIDFGYLGVDTELLFLIGVHSFESLGTLYEGNEDVFQRSTTIVIHTFEPEIGLIKLNIGDTSSFSEGTARLLSQWHDSIPSDAASNLLAGIYEATDSLHSWAVTAETFETIAWLLRQGGRRPSPTAKTLGGSRGEVQMDREDSTVPSPQNPLFPKKNASAQTHSDIATVKPTNPFASAMLNNSPKKDGALSADNTATTKSKVSVKEALKKNSRSSTKTPKKTSKPGDLDYSPSGFGPGGSG